MRRTKIVCTLGPASSTPAMVGRLIEAGLDVARFNFSHGDHATHEARFRTVREEAERRRRPVAVLQDLCGPKLRVGEFPEGMVLLEEGSEVVVTPHGGIGDARRIPVSYPYLAGDLRPGGLILLDDGLLQLEVLRPEGDTVRARVVVGGPLKDHKGFNLPGARLRVPALTEKDRADLAFGLALGVDLVALSFVRGPGDVLEAKELIRAAGRRTPVLAKIEMQEAVDSLEAILDAADGVLVARGDLGVEMGAEKVPLVQKRCIEAANRRGKTVITATQMLESMIDHPRPTRAEASDVANAVLDGSDAVMLSGETAVGKHPVEAVRTMACIIREIESDGRLWRRPPPDEVLGDSTSSAIERAAVIAAKQLGIRVIAVATEHGVSARLVSDYRPEAAIIAITFRPETCRVLASEWGVAPFVVAPQDSTDRMIACIEDLLRREALAEPGELVAMTLGIPAGPGQKTNMLKLHRMP